MKFIIINIISLILFILLSSQYVVAAPVLVAHTAIGSALGTSATTTGIDTSGANFCAIAIASYHGAPATASPTDSNSNTWTALTPQDETALAYIKVWYVVSPTVGVAHTFTASSVGSFLALAVQCWSGAATSMTFDVENSAASPSDNVTSLATGSITPSSTTNFTIASLSAFGARTNFAIDSSFTISDSIANIANNVGIVMAYKIGNSGAQNPTFSWTENTGAAAHISSFKATSSGVTCNSNIILMGAGGC